MLSYITIQNANFSATEIARLLQKLDILTPSSICMCPDFTRNQLRYTAHIAIAEWHAREAVYNLIQRIKDPKREARIIYISDQWWAVEETTAEDIRDINSAAFQRWTTRFDLSDTDSEFESDLDLDSDSDTDSVLSELTDTDTDFEPRPDRKKVLSYLQMTNSVSV